MLFTETTVHSQELEYIEKSLEKGSKKNVVEFTNHIKGELNRLTDKLDHLDDDITTEYSGRGSTMRRRHVRSSAVDLNKDISVSLSDVVDDATTPRNRTSRRVKGGQHFLRVFFRFI